MSAPYLITFTPAGSFFFGGPKGFNDSFFVRSGRFPQPTTIVGALRASLLMKAGLLVQHKRGRGPGRRFVPDDKASQDQAKALTGTAKLNDFEGTPEFGIIQKASPVFLGKKDASGGIADAFFTAPADVMKTWGSNTFRVIDHSPWPARVHNAGRTGRTLFRAETDPKAEGNGPFVGGSAFWADYLKGTCRSPSLIDLEDEDKPDDGKGASPFVSRKQVGIGLKRRRVEAGQFYVKCEYAMKKGWAFGVVAWFAKKPDLTETIHLGGDGSVFHLTAAPIDAKQGLFAAHPVLEALLNDAAGLDAAGSRPKGVAISPLLLDDGESLRNPCLAHALIRSIDNVRMLNSITLTPKAHVRDGRKVLKSNAYRMVPAGSVFFFQETDPSPSVFSRSNTGLVEALGFNQWLNCQ